MAITRIIIMVRQKHKLFEIFTQPMSQYLLRIIWTWSIQPRAALTIKEPKTVTIDVGWETLYTVTDSAGQAHATITQQTNKFLITLELYFFSLQASISLHSMWVFLFITIEYFCHCRHWDNWEKVDWIIFSDYADLFAFFLFCFCTCKVLQNFVFSVTAVNPELNEPGSLCFFAQSAIAKPPLSSLARGRTK